MKYTKIVLVMAGLAVFLFTVSCRKNAGSATGNDSKSNQVILTWNKVAYETMGGKNNQHSLLASRVYAMMHIAMHDALNATQALYETYAYHEEEEDADPEIAAAAAAHRVLATTFPNRKGFLDTALNGYLSAVPQSEGKTKGITVGVEAAEALLEMKHNENGALDPIAKPGQAVKPGDYKVVPPFNFIFAPFWENSKLFSLELKDQFRSVPPPTVYSSEYAVAFNEVKEVGSARSKSRTADQSALAKYWYEDSQDGWNRIARNVAADRKPGLLATARLFALLNMAIADAYTAGWDSKLHYNFWRPLTAIRAAATDGNELTAADADWQPAEITPPIQDYPSTHSVLGNAAAAVLSYTFGDNTSFSMRSPSASSTEASRSFSRFSQAANENANSRVMAGIHFRFSCAAGQEMGNKIGKWTFEHHLKPLQ